jgi:NAD(P)-dependent dehydrogenase (short-subunit alcohol dehydrogenase family)
VVAALTREFAAQWGGRGIRVNALAPSFFPSATSGWLRDPEQREWISINTPLARPPRAEDLDDPLRRRRLDVPLTGKTAPTEPQQR